jgi:hypothetical protein
MLLTSFPENKQRNRSTVKQHANMSSTNKASGKSTFGVELEFIVVAPDAYVHAPHHALYEALQDAVSLPCPFNCKQGSHTLRLPVDDEPPSFWEYNDTDNEFKTWLVTRDCSVKLTDDEKQLLPDGHVYSDVEMPSRILDFANPSRCPHNQIWPCNGEPLMWDWVTEITTIINTIKQKCNKPGWRVFVNGTCGMHVHIGRENFGFNLDTTKNIMGMFTAFERCFDSLLTVDRIAGYENEHSPLPALQLTADARRSIIPWSASPIVQYALPLSVRQYEYLGYHLMAAYTANDYLTWNTLITQGANIDYWLYRIYETTTFAELGEYSTSHTSYTNLEHVVHNDTNKPTIEIRLHPGSLEANEIIAWIDLLSHISIYAESHTTTSVRSTLESCYANPSFTILDIARLVNASPVTLAHYTSFLSPAYHTHTSTTLSTQPQDILSPLYASITNYRISQTSSTAISSRITQKLISGRYGQFPVAFLRQVLPAGIIGNGARFLSDEMEGADQQDWENEVERFIEEVKERADRNGYGVGNGNGGRSLVNLFD